ncbi:hypothetical protein DEM27_08210 [Metarhizobium album]|uniref:Uncharacterized protein n=1 Tax=Metarhizobium album TaxID=2182425 RepID=A0A2U2DST5_9HYPH|nr:hypothetical protein [Rhizobium album]PWE56374.1 hypothetical protein DEM27_08210 [Rhizobium album]
MTVRTITPAAGELVGLSVNASFILVSDAEHLSSSTLFLSAGQVPSGCASVGFHLGDSDYGREMVAAVRATIQHINRRWGLLGDWKPREFEFTGQSAAPFRKRNST